MKPTPRLVTVDLANRTVIDHQQVGDTPDVLAYDADANRIYVAAESGWVSIFDQDHGHLTASGSAFLADGAHSLDGMGGWGLTHM